MSNYGIALCGVSTSQQRLESSSLSAQEVRIIRVARELFNCELVKIWSLDISSRKGKTSSVRTLRKCHSTARRTKR